MSAEVGDVWRSACGMMELRCGDYRDVLADVEPDHVITDPPYSERTHSGHDRAAIGGRRVLSYDGFGSADVVCFVERWTLARGWVAVMSDDALAVEWRRALEASGRLGFAALPCVIPGMTVRLMGDGPSSWSVSLTVARPRSRDFSTWGTLPGAYTATREPGHIGGKPLSLMRQIVRDYSRPGDLICDPCAGGGTTLLAAAIEGRRAIGAELDPVTFEKAVKRLSKPYTPATLFRPGDTTGEQTGLDL